MKPSMKNIQNTSEAITITAHTAWLIISVLQQHNATYSKDYGIDVSQLNLASYIIGGTLIACSVIDSLLAHIKTKPPLPHGKKAITAQHLKNALMLAATITLLAHTDSAPHRIVSLSLLASALFAGAFQKLFLQCPSQDNNSPSKHSSYLGYTAGGFGALCIIGNTAASNSTSATVLYGLGIFLTFISSASLTVHTASTLHSNCKTEPPAPSGTAPTVA